MSVRILLLASVLLLVGCGAASGATPRATVMLATIIRATATPVVTPSRSPDYRAEAAGLLSLVKSHFTPAQEATDALRPEIQLLLDGRLEDPGSLRPRVEEAIATWFAVEDWLADVVPNDKALSPILDTLQVSAMMYESAFLSAAEYLDGNEGAAQSYRDSLANAVTHWHRGVSALQQLAR